MSHAAQAGQPEATAAQARLGRRPAIPRASTPSGATEPAVPPRRRPRRPRRLVDGRLDPRPLCQRLLADQPLRDRQRLPGRAADLHGLRPGGPRAARPTARRSWSSTSRTGGTTSWTPTASWSARDLYAGVAEALGACRPGARQDRPDGRGADAGRPPCGRSRRGCPTPTSLRADELLLGLRLVKSPAEIEMMRYASAVSVELLNAMFAEVADRPNRRRLGRGRVRDGGPAGGGRRTTSRWRPGRTRATSGGRACPASTGRDPIAGRHRPSRHLRRGRRLLLRLRSLDRRRR